MDTKRNDKGVLLSVIFAVCNLAMAFVKIYIGATASSVAIMSDGVNNAIDTVGCALAIIGFTYAKRPSDDEMPNGYGKIEEICAFVVSVLIVLTGIVFAAKAIDKFAVRDRMTFHTSFCYLMGATVVMKIGMAVLAKKVNDYVSSPILKTEFLDSVLDAAVTAVTLICYITTAGKGFGIDAILGFTISVVITIYGFKLAKNNFMLLAGRQDPKKRAAAAKALEEAALSVENLRLHGYGHEKTLVTATVHADENEEEKIEKAKNNLSEEGFDSCLEKRR